MLLVTEPDRTTGHIAAVTLSQDIALAEAIPRCGGRAATQHTAHHPALSACAPDHRPDHDGGPAVRRPDHGLCRPPQVTTLRGEA